MTDQPIEGAGAQTITLDVAGRPLSHVLRDLEREYICRVLNSAGGNKAQAAQAAGMTYQTFTRKLAALDLKVTYRVG